MSSLTIRGMKGLLEISIDDSPEFEEIIKDFDERIQDSPLFFRGAVVSFLWGSRKITSSEKKRLKSFLDQQEILWEKSKDRYCKDKKQEKPEKIDSVEGLQQCLFINKNVRAGTRIEFDGHVVIYGNVHAGAEIIATGNVFVWGVLRGIVHAGATGAKNASIAALVLNPTQLRIADQVAINPQQYLRESIELHPEQATIEGEDITVKAWAQKKD